MRASQPVQREPASLPRPLFLLFWCIGILMGLFVRDFVETAGEGVSEPRPVAAAGGDAGYPLRAAPTFVVNVRAVLDLPTATPTGTATPPPTATPDRTPALDFCGAVPAAEGMVCRMPLPTATATPTLPACFSPEAAAGQLCQYRSTSVPASAARRDPDSSSG